MSEQKSRSQNPPATLISYKPRGCDTLFNSFSFSFTLQGQKSDFHPLNHHFQQGCWVELSYPSFWGNLAAPSPPSGHQGSHLLTLAPRPLKTSWKLQPVSFFASFCSISCCAKEIPFSRSTYLRYPDHHATCHVLPCCDQSSASFSLGGLGTSDGRRLRSAQLQKRYGWGKRNGRITTSHHFFWPFHLPDFPLASSGTHVTTKTDLYRIKVCFCIILTFCHKVSGIPYIPYAGHFSEAAFSGKIRAWLNA